MTQPEAPDDPPTKTPAKSPAKRSSASRRNSPKKPMELPPQPVAAPPFMAPVVQLSPAGSSGASGARMSTTAVPSGAAPTGAVTALDDRQLSALWAKAKAVVAVPAQAFVVGDSIEVLGIHYNGRPRAGLRAQCRRAGNVYEVSLADVAFPPESPGAQVVSSYRAWMGLEEMPAWTAHAVAAPSKRRKALGGNITLGEPVELIVLASKSQSLRCRILGTALELTLRTTDGWQSPGEIITVLPTKHWTQAKQAHLTGAVQSTRSDVQALGLTPLPLREYGEWDPKKHSWGEANPTIDDWAKYLLEAGPRPMYEFKPGLTETDHEDFESNPLIQASKLNVLGEGRKARDLLMDLLAQDLRCLDAHALLGDFLFESAPELALRHYAMGVNIGKLSLGPDFTGVLPWALLHNRPFLRCFYGLAQCYWRLGKTEEASAIFRRMLWMNPTDNQGARLELAAIDAGETWQGDS